jgi:hypothetical protein
MIQKFLTISHLIEMQAFSPVIVSARSDQFRARAAGVDSSRRDSAVPSQWCQGLMRSSILLILKALHIRERTPSLVSHISRSS